MPLLFSHMHKHSTTTCCSVLRWGVLTQSQYRTVRCHGRLRLPSNPNKYIMEVLNRLWSILHSLSTTSHSPYRRHPPPWLCEDFCNPYAATATSPFCQRCSAPYSWGEGRGTTGRDRTARPPTCRRNMTASPSRPNGDNVAQNKFCLTADWVQTDDRRGFC